MMENQFVQFNLAIESTKAQIVKAVNEIVQKSGLPAPVVIMVLHGIIADTKIAEYEQAFASAANEKAAEEARSLHRAGSGR